MTEETRRKIMKIKDFFIERKMKLLQRKNFSYKKIKNIFTLLFI